MVSLFTAARTGSGVEPYDPISMMLVVDRRVHKREMQTMIQVDIPRIESKILVQSVAKGRRGLLVQLDWIYLFQGHGGESQKASMTRSDHPFSF